MGKESKLFKIEIFLNHLIMEGKSLFMTRASGVQELSQWSSFKDESMNQIIHKFGD